MKYKEDWDEAREKWSAWWGRQPGAKLALAVRAPRNKPVGDVPEVSSPENVEQQWLDVEHRLAATIRGCATTYHGGLAFPFFDSNLGPGSLALYLGSEPTLMPDTVWYRPFMGDLQTALPLRYDPGNKWWKLHLQMLRDAVRVADGDFMVTIPDLIENVDTFASLRGSIPLLYDMVDCPDAVHDFLNQILDLWFVYYDQCYDLVKDETGGSCFSSFHIWAPGRIAKLQCDAGALLSPELFDEFVAPYLEKQCQRLDATVFHLDGPDNVRHLDSLLALPSLDAIQWTPGSGQPGTGDPTWFPMYRKILKGGKLLLLLGVQVELVEEVVRQLGRDGVMILTSTKTEDEARDLLRRAEQW